MLKMVVARIRRIGWLGQRAVELAFAALFFPFALPLFIRGLFGTPPLAKPGLSLALLVANFYVWFLIYFYLLWVIVYPLGVPVSADGLFATPPPRPGEYFDWFFFSLYFPLLSYYHYLVRTNGWDPKSVREHFAEHVPTPEEIRETEEERKRKREKWGRIRGYFRRSVRVILPILAVLFGGVNLGADEAMSWIDIVFLVVFSSVGLAAAFALFSETRNESHRRTNK